MFTLPQAMEIYFCVVPIDMRRSFDTLAEVVRTSLGHEPKSGHLFVFRNKAEDCLKILYWDTNGYAIWYKRLEKGKFTLPCSSAASVEMSAANFSMLLNGFDLKKVERQKRYTSEQIGVSKY